MVVHRNLFFLSLFLILFTVVAAGKLIWYVRAAKTTGVFAFQGRGNALEQMRMSSYEAWFKLNNDTVYFKREGNLGLNPGTPVTILYQPIDPADARVYTLVGFWGSAVVYGGIVLLVLLAIYLHPEIVPRRAKLRLFYKKPFIQLV